MKHLPIMFTAALACAGTALAQTAITRPTESIVHQKVVTDAGTHKLTSGQYFGQVKSYETGKSITITAPGHHKERTKKIDLTGKNLTAEVNPSVAVGDWVTVHEMTKSNGQRTVAVKKSGTSTTAGYGGAARRK